MNACTNFQDELAACAVGQSDMSAEASRHLRACEHCRARFEQWKWVAANLSENARNLPPPKREPRLEAWFAKKVSGTSERSLAGLNFGRILGASLAALALIVLCILVNSIFSPKQTTERVVAVSDDPATGKEADPSNSAAVPNLGVMRRELQVANSANFVPIPQTPEGFRPYRLKDAYLESRN